MGQIPNEFQFDGAHGGLLIRRYEPGIVLLKVTGTDIGEFGEAPMNSIDEWLDQSAPVDFFIDARDGRGVSIDVSGDWALWMGANRAKFRSVTMLTGSAFIQLTAGFVRRFAALEGIMRICTQPAVFDQALGESISSNVRHAKA